MNISTIQLTKWKKAKQEQNVKNQDLNIRKFDQDLKGVRYDTGISPSPYSIGNPGSK